MCLFLALLSSPAPVTCPVPRRAHTSSVGLRTHPVIEAGAAAAGAGVRTALLDPCLLHHSLRLPLPGQEHHLIAVHPQGIQAASKPPGDPLGMRGVEEPSEEQVGPAVRAATGPWQWEGRVS